jgi:hypothetical protein
MAGQLRALQQGVTQGHHMVSDLSSAQAQFEAIGENLVLALSRRQTSEADALIDAGEKLAARLHTGVQQLARHLDDMQQITLDAVHELPTDHRVVWKQVLLPPVLLSKGVLVAHRFVEAKRLSLSWLFMCCILFFFTHRNLFFCK